MIITVILRFPWTKKKLEKWKNSKVLENLLLAKRCYFFIGIQHFLTKKQLEGRFCLLSRQDSLPPLWGYVFSPSHFLYLSLCLLPSVSAWCFSLYSPLFPSPSFSFHLSLWLSVSLPFPLCSSPLSVPLCLPCCLSTVPFLLSVSASVSLPLFPRLIPTVSISLSHSALSIPIFSIQLSLPLYFPSMPFLSPGSLSSLRLPRSMFPLCLFSSVSVSVSLTLCIAFCLTLCLPHFLSLCVFPSVSCPFWVLLSLFSCFPSMYSALFYLQLCLPFYLPSVSSPLRVSHFLYTPCVSPIWFLPLSVSLLYSRRVSPPTSLTPYLSLPLCEQRSSFER